MNERLLWLRRRFSWMGAHSGYDLLCDAIAASYPGETRSIWQSGRVRRGWTRGLRRLQRGARPSPMYALDATQAEAEALVASWRFRPQLVHVTYVENQLGILPQWRSRSGWKLVGTVHQPAGWWRLLHPYPAGLGSLDAAIVPSRNELAYFEQFLPGRVFYVPHGVDLEFFCPPEPSERRSQVRCLYSGKYLRDLDGLAQTVERVLASNPAVHFDLLLPRASRDRSPALLQLARHPQVCWHADLGDEQLRQLYRNASVLLLPLLDCTANNALVEGIASGLPVVSTQVGGLPDYTRSSFADLVPLGDAAGMAAAVLRLAANPQERRDRGALARRYAEEHLSWQTIAAQTVAVYERVLATGAAR